MASCGDPAVPGEVDGWRAAGRAPDRSGRDPGRPRGARERAGRPHHHLAHPPAPARAPRHAWAETASRSSMGSPWSGPESAAAVRAAAGAEARLVRYEGPERFDVLPLLVGTDGAFEQLGVDHRRLRPNIVIGGVDGLAERGWPGQAAADRRSRHPSVAKLRARCVMTTYDPDTLVQDLSVLRRIASEFGGQMALDCDVAERGPDRGGRPGRAAGGRGGGLAAGGAHHPGEVLVHRGIVGQLGVEGSHHDGPLAGHHAFAAVLGQRRHRGPEAPDARGARMKTILSGRGPRPRSPEPTVSNDSFWRP